MVDGCYFPFKGQQPPYKMAAAEGTSAPKGPQDSHRCKCCHLIKAELKDGTGGRKAKKYEEETERTDDNDKEPVARAL